MSENQLSVSDVIAPHLNDIWISTFFNCIHSKCEWSFYNWWRYEWAGDPSQNTSERLSITEQQQFTNCMTSDKIKQLLEFWAVFNDTFSALEECFVYFYRFLRFIRILYSTCIEKKFYFSISFKKKLRLTILNITPSYGKFCFKRGVKQGIQFYRINIKINCSLVLEREDPPTIMFLVIK